MYLELTLESDGHPSEHEVWLVRSEDRVELEVDGQRLEATVTRAPDGSLLVHLDGHELRVEVTGDTTARIAGHAVGFRIPTFQPGGAPGEHDTQVAGQGVVRPPMPGKVVTLDVAEGDVVEKGQRLAVLEAMKMQSTIEAPRSGRVVAIHVDEGEAVDAKDVLLEIEEDA